MRVLRLFAVVGVVASATAAIISCSSDATPVNDGTPPDASTPDVSTQRPPVTAPDAAQNASVDAGVVNEASDASDTSDASDARSDASDAHPPVSACTVFLPTVCNFDGICPAYSTVGIGTPSGNSGYAKDAGPDGSTAFFGSVGDGGGAGFFGMPFFDFTQPGIDPATTFPTCQVVCEANMRVASGAGTGASILVGGGSTWTLDLDDAGDLHRSPDASALHTVTAGSGWFHVRIQMTPNPGGATSEVTIIDSADASTTTSVPVPNVGTSLSFGAYSTTPPSSDVLVYVDDVTCQISDIALE